MIGIIDYGLGNIEAIANIYKRTNIDYQFVRTPKDLESSTRLILPGVGAFDWAMERLQGSGLVSQLTHKVLDDGVPILGICVGMQMLARKSSEGQLPGLGWVDAEVIEFDASIQNEQVQRPHMGWNDVEPVGADPLFAGLVHPQFYFLHSYYFLADSAPDVIASTHYHIDFTSAVRSGNVFGVQFHPEKSHDWGVSLLANFATMTC